MIKQENIVSNRSKISNKLILREKPKVISNQTEKENEIELKPRRIIFPNESNSGKNFNIN